MRSSKLFATHRFVLLALCLALGVVPLVAGCSGGGSTGEQSKPVAQATQPQTQATAKPMGAASVKAHAPSSKASLDPCSLLTKEEVEAAVGNPVEEPSADITNSCKWDKGDPAKISVAVHLLSLPEAAKCAAGREGSSPVTDLGVEASWRFVDPAETGSVVACPQGWQVQITLVGDIVNHGTKEATLRAAGEELMRKALKRM